MRLVVLQRIVKKPRIVAAQSLEPPVRGRWIAMAMCAPAMREWCGLWGIAVYPMTVQQASWSAAPTFGL